MGRISITKRRSTMNSQKAAEIISSPANGWNGSTGFVGMEEKKKRMQFLGKHAFQADDRPLNTEEILMLPLALVRTALCFILFSLMFLLRMVNAQGIKEGEPLPEGPWKGVSNINTVFPTLFCLVLGINVTTKGQIAPTSECAIAVVAPHTSWMDSIVLSKACGGNVISFVAKTLLPLWIQRVFVGTSIFVDRDSSDSKTAVAKRIEDVASHAKDYRQTVVLFPEGTCANRTALLKFKTGAFKPGLPVQGIALKYQDEAAWCSGSGRRFFLFLRNIGKLYHSVEVEFLPVQVPDEEDVANPSIFAGKVQSALSSTLGLDICEGSYSDRNLALICSKNKRGSRIDPAKVLDFYAEEVGAYFELTAHEEKKYLLKQIQSLLVVFVSVCNKEGTLDLAKFDKFVNPDKRKLLLKLFKNDKREMDKLDVAVSSLKVEEVFGKNSKVSFREVLLKTLSKLY